MIVMGHRANTARWLRRHLSRTLVGELHSRGLAVAAWTVNDPRGRGGSREWAWT
ncbi:hypothetical protein [Pyrodictium occultum]|uniref:hypothetical protein n=1 Tax=Pyrodictium occultum TaxID=2309 RepID=UPI0014434BB8|nr:hypothetical protein [Pyrodictium occultum]